MQVMATTGDCSLVRNNEKTKLQPGTALQPGDKVVPNQPGSGVQLADPTDRTIKTVGQLPEDGLTITEDGALETAAEVQTEEPDPTLLAGGGLFAFLLSTEGAAAAGAALAVGAQAFKSGGAGAAAFDDEQPGTLEPLLGGVSAGVNQLTQDTPLAPVGDTVTTITNITNTTVGQIGDNIANTVRDIGLGPVADLIENVTGDAQPTGGGGQLGLVPGIVDAVGGLLQGTPLKPVGDLLEQAADPLAGIGDATLGEIGFLPSLKDAQPIGSASALPINPIPDAGP